MFGINGQTNSDIIKNYQGITEDSVSVHHSIKLLLNLND